MVGLSAWSVLAAKAVAHLTASADRGNPYAQYALGKLYLAGQDVKQDREAAWNWFYRSSEQGNEYAQCFLDHFCRDCYI